MAENENAFISMKVPKEMGPMVEEIRAARLANFESTSNTSIARDAVKALHEKIVKR